MTNRSTSHDAPATGGSWLVVGLGNPGPQYVSNRHNLGILVVSAWAEENQASWKNHGHGITVAEFRAGVGPGGAPGPKVIAAQLGCYMNVSGGPTKALCDYYRIPPERLIVVHDELDLPFGELRLKQGGGEGGHNGLRSITGALKTKDYLRLRGGIGRPPAGMDPVKWVLGNFPKAADQTLGDMIDLACATLEEIPNRGFLEAQMRLHSRGGKK